MNSPILRLTVVLVIVFGFPLQLSLAAPVYIGDDAAQGLAVTDLGNADGANSGTITYGFDTDSLVNTSGGSQDWLITEVNFWADFAGRPLTPYVATYNGGGVAVGANFNVLAKGDPITSVAGVNNAAFTVGGSTPTVSLADGGTLVAGFFQQGQIVPFGAGAGGDYLRENDQIPPSGPLGSNATWSNLGRTYAFNVGIEPGQVIPEPSSVALIVVALFSLSGVGLMRWRRRKRA